MDMIKKTQVEKALVIGLLLFFAFTLRGSLKSAGIVGHRPAPKTADSAVLETTSIPAAPVAPPVAGRPVPAATRRAPAPQAAAGYSAKAARDPLKSLLPKKPLTVATREDTAGSDSLLGAPLTLPGLLLQGVWWGEEDGRALINGHLYGVGDRVEGATITTIGRDGVMLQFEGAIFLLPVAGDPVQVGMPQGAR